MPILFFNSHEKKNIESAKFRRHNVLAVAGTRSYNNSSIDGKEATEQSFTCRACVTGNFSDEATLRAALGEHLAVNLQDRQLSVWEACIPTQPQTIVCRRRGEGARRFIRKLDVVRTIFVCVILGFFAFRFSLPQPTIQPLRNAHHCML